MTNLLLAASLLLPPELPVLKQKHITQVQSDTRQLLILQGIKTTNNVVFKYPTNVNLTVWHDTKLYISIDNTNWIYLGKNVIQLGLPKSLKSARLKQEIVN